VPLVLSDVTGQRGNGQWLTRAAAFNGRVIVVDRERVLLGQQGSPPMLTLFGQPRHGCVPEYCTNLVTRARRGRKIRPAATFRVECLRRDA
jgi:hypothetical protein